MAFGHAILLEHNIEGVDAMVALHNATRATDLGSDHYLRIMEITVTLNLF